MRTRGNGGLLVLCWLALLLLLLGCVSPSAAQSTEVCKHYRAGCEQVCRDEFNTSPSNLVCSLDNPQCVCGANRSEARQVAMQGIQRAVTSASNALRSVESRACW
ncbi:hypothetical protein V8E36_009964 [Tilletia maclaganii]